MIYDNCDKRVNYCNKSYCTKELKDNDCEYLDIMGTEIVSFYNNIPVYLPGCSFLEKIVEEWYN